MARKKKGGGGGPSWMDTYGDLVTLLLCFFVLLYSISSVDQQKYKNLVLSLNPDAELEDPKNEGNPEGQDGTSAGFSSIEQALRENMAAAGVDADVTIAEGDGYHFISFSDNLFFAGDSSVVTPEGQVVLDAFCDAVQPSADTVKEIRVLGHTTQALPDEINEVVSDRQLSAMRSANVVIYLQQREIVPAACLVSMGYGQFHPIAPFDTEENRSRNRRCEIIITEKGSNERSLSDYYTEIYGTDITVSDSQ